MSQRLEAATTAFHHAMEQPVSIPSDWEPEITAALKASDDVLFSEDAVEKAARELWILNGLKGDDWIYCPPEDERKVYFTRHARTVIGALKEAANV